MIYKELERKNGHTIIVKNAIEGYKLNILAIDGKSEQNQLSGKNLLKNNATTQTVNGVTFIVNEDGSIVANGTATADSTLIINNKVSDFSILENNVEYILMSDRYKQLVQTCILIIKSYLEDVKNTIGYDFDELTW